MEKGDGTHGVLTFLCPPRRSFPSMQFTPRENSLVLWYLTAPTTGRPALVSLSSPLRFSQRTFVLSPESLKNNYSDHFPGHIGVGKNDALRTNWVINRAARTRHSLPVRVHSHASRSLLFVISDQVSRRVNWKVKYRCERENVNSLAFVPVKPTLKIRLTLPVSYECEKGCRDNQNVPNA